MKSLLSKAGKTDVTQTGRLLQDSGLLHMTERQQGVKYLIQIWPRIRGG